MRIWGLSLVVILALSVVEAYAQERQSPVREARSANGQFRLIVEPGRPGRVGRNCQATLYEHRRDRHDGRCVWERALVNETAPAVVEIRDDGRFVITLDEYRRGGARNALVIYGAEGELLRHFLLTDLLQEPDWKHVQVNRRSVDWLREARFSFDDSRKEFVIDLNWKQQIRIDLQTLQIVRPGAGGATALTVVPAEMLAALLGHVEGDREQVIAKRLAELSELTSEEQARTAEIAEMLSPEQAAGDEAAPDPAELAADTIVETETTVTRASEDGVTRTTSLTVLEDGTVVADEIPADENAWIVSPLTEIAVPMPNPVKKVDYVAWLNAQGQVEGPDAAPLYEAAVENLAKFEGDPALLDAARAGDPEALQSPEISAYLAANANALATFRTAAQYPQKGWHFESADGSMMSVLLPHLQDTRTLSQASILQGRQFAATGDPQSAAEIYLAALAAGRHVGTEYTLISNIVGESMQTESAQALLDLAASPQASQIDFLDLAAEVEDIYVAPRSIVDAIQAERAFFMDSVQRLWDVDPQTGTRAFDSQQARQFLETVADTSDEAHTQETIAQMAAVDFDQTVATANQYYDAVSQAVTLPYAEAQVRLEALETDMVNDSSNALMRQFAPSLGQYNFIKTKHEAVRRATKLVSNLQAYHQAYGEYPPDLLAFGDLEFAVDPFSSSHFRYRREGDSFVLYSVGGDMADDAGNHERSGRTLDLRFWPRPE